MRHYKPRVKKDRIYGVWWIWVDWVQTHYYSRSKEIAEAWATRKNLKDYDFYNECSITWRNIVNAGGQVMAPSKSIHDHDAIELKDMPI